MRSTVCLLPALYLATVAACASPQPRSGIDTDRAALAIAAADIGDFLPGTHAHNDYQHARPLWTALAHGFASIEVDVVLQNGILYVAHDEGEVERDRTIESLYLRPLSAIAAARGGRIYASPAPPLQLLVDVKGLARSSLDELERLLERYPGLATRWVNGEAREGAITIVLSGHRATSRARGQAARTVAIDGRPTEDRSTDPTALVPLVSASWNDTELAAHRWQAARRMVETVQAEGRAFRFWSAPDNEEGWAQLSEIGVDYIGTDDIEGLAAFLRSTAR